MLSRRPLPLLLAAALTGSALVAGPSWSKPSDPGLRAVADPTVVSFGDGDRAQLVPAGQGRQVLQPLPRPDGTTPPLTFTSDGRSTTVAAADSSAAPVLVEGKAAPLRTSAAADDLVELRLESKDRFGRPSPAHVNIFDVETGAVSAYRTLPGDPAAECSADPSSPAACILVPPGTYSLMALVATMPQDKPSKQRELIVQNLSLVGDAEVELTDSRTFTFDARKAKRIKVETKGAHTRINTGGALELGYTRTAENGDSIKVWQDPGIPLDRNFYMQPTAQVKAGDLQTLTRIRLEAPDIELDAPRTGPIDASYYDPVWFSDISSQFPVFNRRDRLRVVDAGHATRADLAGRNLRGALAVVERSDDLSIAQQSNHAARKGAALVAVYNDRPGDNGDPGTIGRALEAPTLRLSRADGRDLLDLRRRDLVRTIGRSATPYVYDMVLKEKGAIGPDLTYSAVRGPNGNLSQQVRSFHGQPGVAATFAEAAYPWQPGDTLAASTLFPVRSGPQTRSEYRLADPDTRWNFATSVPETTYNAIFPHDPVQRMFLGEPGNRTYAAGEKVLKPVGAAPVTAAPNPALPFERFGDELAIYISSFTDADGNHGTSYTDESGMSTHLLATADDEVIADSTGRPTGIALLPAGDSRIDITLTTDNPQSWAALSTRTETTWTFQSAAPPEGEAVVQPAIVADYDVAVDLRNRSTSRDFGLNLAHLDGSDAPIDVTVAASYDDGVTWQPATVAGDRVTLPHGAGFVSLKVHASDDAGSVLDQTIIRAWLVP